MTDEYPKARPLSSSRPTKGGGARGGIVGQELHGGRPAVPSLRAAWTMWLGDQHWDSWATLTFSTPRTAQGCTQAFRVFRAWCDSHSPDLWAHFVAQEAGRLGRLHLHALLRGVTGLGERKTPCLPDGDPRKVVSGHAAWRWWFDRYGRAQILPYRKTGGAEAYVTKYIAKGLGEFDFEGLSPWRETRQIEYGQMLGVRPIATGYPKKRGTCLRS